MNRAPSYTQFDNLKRRYLLLRLVEIILLATGTSLLTFALASLMVPASFTKLLLSLVAGAVVFIVQAILYKLFKLNSSMLAKYLNRKYPLLKESADLLIRDENELPPIQQLQQIQTQQNFNSIYHSIHLPHHLVQAGGIFLFCLTANLVLTGFSAPSVPRETGTTSTATEIKPNNGDTTATFIKALEVNIHPPRYTHLKTFTASSPHLTIPEGSDVNWLANFSRDVKNVNIIFSGKDSAYLLKSGDNRYSIQKTVAASGFYQLQWTDRLATHRSDYYKIEVTEDQSPKVDVTNLLQFTKLRVTDNLNIEIKSSLRDDYGLTDADIVATVSKGSGESVKFREERLRFGTPAKIEGKDIQAHLTVNLLKLGLEPGDELYFYVQASDNKVPHPNHARTETYFISLQDTTAEITVADAGLGVDLMPEYFRSQRQIIIDTEKLLREKKKLSRQTFNSTSNELGYDQKVLRLRYGQFLGEEADSGIGQQAASQETGNQEEEKDKDPSKEFGHKHDTENEHNLVESKKDHDHDGEVKNPEEQEDPMKEFMHSHDNTEEATFFIQSVKAKLKAALTLMWDAELYLRLYEPAKSLPYQYKILNLLKEISNDSRIYVHRTGFDPPPLKEDKRLTADLSDVKTSTNQYDHNPDEALSAIRNTIVLTEEKLTGNQLTFSPPERQIIEKAGQELATITMEQPGVHLRTLSLLKSLLDQQVKKEEMKMVLTEIRRDLWNTLPDASLSPTRPLSTTHLLDEKFLKSLEEIKHE